MRGLTVAVVAAATMGSAANGQATASSNMTLDAGDLQTLFELWSSPNTITGGSALGNCVQAARGVRTPTEPWACATGCSFQDSSKFECDETDGSLITIKQGPATSTKLKLVGNLPIPKLIELPLTTLWLPPQDNRDLVATEVDEETDMCIDMPMSANWYTDPRAYCGWQGGNQSGLIFGGFYTEILGEGSGRWCFQGSGIKSIVTCEAAHPKLPISLVFPANANQVTFGDEEQEELNDILNTFGSSLVTIDMSGWSKVKAVKREKGRNDDCIKIPKCLLEGVTCTMPKGTTLCPKELPTCGGFDAEDDCNNALNLGDCFWDAAKDNCKYKLACADIGATSEFCDPSGTGKKKSRSKACKGKKLVKTCRLNLFEQCSWDNKDKTCVASAANCDACNDDALDNKKTKKCCKDKKTGNRWACDFTDPVEDELKGSCAVKAPKRTVPGLADSP